MEQERNHEKLIMPGRDVVVFTHMFHLQQTKGDRRHPIETNDCTPDVVIDHIEKLKRFYPEHELIVNVLVHGFDIHTLNDFKLQYEERQIDGVHIVYGVETYYHKPLSLRIRDHTGRHILMLFEDIPEIFDRPLFKFYSRGEILNVVRRNDALLVIPHPSRGLRWDSFSVREVVSWVKDCEDKGIPVFIEYHWERWNIQHELHTLSEEYGILVMTSTDHHNGRLAPLYPTFMKGDDISKPVSAFGLLKNAAMNEINVEESPLPFSLRKRERFISSLREWHRGGSLYPFVRSALLSYIDSILRRVGIRKGS